MSGAGGGRVVLASGNRGKFNELAPMLASFGFELLPQDQVCADSAEETASTFIENALLKARHVAQRTGLPVIADDSGLAVEYLDGAPGVWSARYAGEGADDAANNSKLLAALDGVPAALRGASFHCVLVLLRSALDPVPLIATGCWSGSIVERAAGGGGFGYDPLFYLPDQGCTAAELLPGKKRILSHRGQALTSLMAQLRPDAE
ncbi:MAG: RdgB/HAM1 family non-canonical purine NTP pyrophosphatase [Gammaproteobacteria bacterium]|nr:RdgB/HAM1 family non-canonical purine NTP pyrophosphatase [Gammaproteobacteria bacterium]